MLKKFFKKYHITEKDTIIIACSGGPDSMFLVTEIIKIHPKNHIIIAHFNHCLRGKESDADEKFVKKFCEDNQLIGQIGCEDISKIATESKKGIEETARIERYSFLETVRVQYKAKFILTAHHLDDAIETLLFNLIRGAKINGLTGIPEQNGNILRPLLNIEKSLILKTLSEQNISYRLDLSNTDDTYLRNHLRLNILSEFDRINPEYRKNLHSFMDYMSELRINLDTEVKKFLGDSSSFSVKEFQGLSLFLQREIIRYLYEQANQGTIGLSEGVIAEIIRFINDKGNYTKKQIHDLWLQKKNFRVYIL